MFEPIKNTSYFAQGSTIKADIEVNLDKVELLQKNTQTPEAKIRSYREAVIELNAAKAKLDDLKVLVASAGSVGTVFGFVGGVQTLAVWGLIIILLAGFVFLALYMKVLNPSAKSGTKVEKEPDKPIKTADRKKPTPCDKENLTFLALIKEIISLSLSKDGPKSAQNVKRSLKIASISLLLVSVAGISAWYLMRSNDDIINPVNLATEITLPPTKPTPIPEPDSTEPLIFPEDTLHEFIHVSASTPSASETISGESAPSAIVVVDANHPTVIVRKTSSPEAEIISRVWVTKKALVLDQSGDWVKIRIDGTNEQSSIEGWILQSSLSTDE